VARFLTADWLDEVAGAVASGGGTGRISGDVSLTVRQVVRGGPDGDVSYSVRFGDGRVSLTPGPGDEADIEVTSRYETAVAISKGEVSPAVAMASGALHVSGRVDLLSQHREAWTALDDLLAPVRATTEY
jgi:hypothetical protein